MANFSIEDLGLKIPPGAADSFEVNVELSQNLTNLTFFQSPPPLDEDLSPSVAECIAAAFFCIVFILVGCVGNLLTIVALSTSTRLRNATTAFVISLAVADFLFCSINLPLTASRYIHRGWILGETLCMLFPFFFYGNVAASLMSMVAITFNRFVLILFHHLYEKIYQKTNIIVMIVSCWMFSFALLLPTLGGIWGKFGYNKASFSCTILQSEGGKSPKKFLFIIGFVIPTATIIICYLSIFYKVRRSGRNLKSYSTTKKKKNSHQISQRTSDEIHLTRLILIIFCTFILCFLPLMIVNVFEKDIRHPIIHILASVLAWMSSCTNPIIYAVLNRQYRQAYLRLFRHGRAAAPSQASVDSTRSSSCASRCSRQYVSNLFVRTSPLGRTQKEKGIKDVAI